MESWSHGGALQATPHLLCANQAKYQRKMDRAKVRAYRRHQDEVAAAARFIAAHREHMQVPPGVTFRYEPRSAVKRKTHGLGKTDSGRDHSTGDMIASGVFPNPWVFRLTGCRQDRVQEWVRTSHVVARGPHFGSKTFRLEVLADCTLEKFVERLQVCLERAAIWVREYGTEAPPPQKNSHTHTHTQPNTHTQQTHTHTQKWVST